MKRKVVVAGCSVSDYTHVDKVYGEMYSKKIKARYLHEGAGCGSNYRMWRKLGHHIMSGNVTKDDIVILQPTQLARREYYSPFTAGGEHLHGSNGKSLLNETYNSEGSIVRYKPNAHTDVLSAHPIEKKFSELRDNFFDPDFEAETFRNQMNMFQALCSCKDINLWIIDVGYVNNIQDCIWNKSKSINMKWIRMSHPLMDPKHGRDTGHFSQEGHRVAADTLLNTI